MAYVVLEQGSDGIRAHAKRLETVLDGIRAHTWSCTKVRKHRMAYVSCKQVSDDIRAHAKKVWVAYVALTTVREVKTLELSKSGGQDLKKM